MPDPTPSDAWMVTQEQVAAWLGITPRHVRTLEAKGLPRESRKKASRGYHWPSVLQWWIEYQVGVGTRSSDPSTLEDLEERKLRAGVELLELQVAETRRSLVHREVAEEVRQKAFAAVADHLAGIPERWAPHLLDAAGPRDVLRRIQPLAQAEIDALRSLPLEGPEDDPSDLDA